MAAHRKLFRIETMSSPGQLPLASMNLPAGGDDQRHAEIMAQLRAIRAAIAPVEEVSAQVSGQMLDAYKHEHAEAMKLKTELDAIWEAINQTKHEIASVHVTGFNGKQMARVTNELDAIVGGTAGATDTILSAAETIDNLSNNLAAAVRDEHDRQMAQDIQEQVVQIFEACNFQDLTGQRITKVVSTLKFIEDRIVKMMEIWGGIDSFREIEVQVIAEPEGEAALLNGPRLEDEAGHASQDDIDALFD